MILLSPQIRYNAKRRAVGAARRFFQSDFQGVVMSWVYCLRPVPGHKGYFADRNGNIYSQRRRSCGGLGKTIKRLTPIEYRGGYLRVSFSVDNKYRKVAVHRAILSAFVGESNLQTRHLDGDPKNNRLENLCYGTGKENWGDRFLHGTDFRGDKSAKAKLTWETVRMIRSIKDESQESIAKRFGTSQSNVSAIMLNRIWIE